MRNICFYFEIHLPVRLKRYRFFEIGQDHYYYDDYHSEEQVRYFVERSYLPANRIIADMIKSSNGKFKCSFSISGVTLELFEQYAPELIDSFKELSKTNCVEFLVEPYANSLASVFDIDEFEAQIKQHADKIEALFGQRPSVLRNSELIYSDEIAEKVYKMGYKTMLLDGAKHVMGWKSPNYMYNHAYKSGLKLLVRNNQFSDDITFRFSDYSWNEYPLTAEKYAFWMAQLPVEEEVVNIWMGYDVLGIVQNEATGIFEFFKALPYYVMENQMGFMLPSEAGKKLKSVGELSVSYPISWSGEGKDLTAWMGNDLQQEALNKLYGVGERVRLTVDRSLKHDWLYLQPADHFRFMSHSYAYGSNYESPYEAFINYMNVLADFLERVDAQYPTTIENEELNALLKTINNQEKEIVELQDTLKKLRTRKKKE
ncbi:MAG: glycoside hydrolase family 57 protein [Prevotellaceae bacterium]|jgi:alpha-amylase|nr:glycoside hydrolase family 57 protein [Prevotellaceae bacterium]